MKTFIKTLVLLFVFSSIFSQKEGTKNTVIVESNFILSLSFSYDREIPIKEKMALMVGADYVMGVGFGYGSHFVAPEVNLLLLGPRHHMEIGALYILNIFSPEDGNDSSSDYDEDSSPGARIAYRFQSRNGICFRLNIGVFPNIDPLIFPAIGVGYAF